MCKTSSRTDATEPPVASRRVPRRVPRQPASHGSDPSTSGSQATTTDRSTVAASSKPSASSASSLPSIRSSLSENPHVYSLPEISSATNNFLSKRISPTSSGWRCSLRGQDAVVFQRKLQRPILDLRPLLSSLCKSHHSAIVDLLGACLTDNDIYLVYRYVPGIPLSDCLRNPRNPSFTALNTWLSRIRIAADLSDGLHYIHRSSGLNLRLVHNHFKSSSIIVSDPRLDAKICHFGTAQLAGESPDPAPATGTPGPDSDPSTSKMRRSGSRRMLMRGTAGYMAPELCRHGIVSQKTDVYAFGVFLLELMSGEKPTRDWYDRQGEEFRTVSVIDTAREARESNSREGAVRRWMDRRLNDSFPVEIALRLIDVALECVQPEPEKRPEMERVAGKVSRMFLESEGWAKRMAVPTDITASFAPR